MCVCGCNCCKTFISAWPKLARDLFPCHCSPLSLFLSLFLPSLSLYPAPCLWARPPSLCCLLKPFCVIIFCGFAFSILPRRLPFVLTHTHTHKRTHTHTHTGTKVAFNDINWVGGHASFRPQRARTGLAIILYAEPATHTVTHS